MIQREEKRERLIAKHLIKREAIKEELKTVSSFKERVSLYKKFERIPRNSSSTWHRSSRGAVVKDCIEILMYQNML